MPGYFHDISMLISVVRKRSLRNAAIREIERLETIRPRSALTSKDADALWELRQFVELHKEFTQT
jgi:hypothetical protein